MRVKNVMTKNPSCCVPSDPAPRAATIMRDEDTGIVPVIDNEQSQRIVGVVTDRDLCMNVVAESREPATVAVEQCMTTVVVTCAPGDAVEKAIGQAKKTLIEDHLDHCLDAVVGPMDVSQRQEIADFKAIAKYL